MFGRLGLLDLVVGFGLVGLVQLVWFGRFGLVGSRFGRFGLFQTNSGSEKRLSSIKGCLPSKIVFVRRCHPSKVMVGV